MAMRNSGFSGNLRRPFPWCWKGTCSHRTGASRRLICNPDHRSPARTGRRSLSAWFGRRFTVMVLDKPWLHRELRAEGDCGRPRNGVSRLVPTRRKRSYQKASTTLHVKGTRWRTWGAKRVKAGEWVAVVRAEDSKWVCLKEQCHFSIEVKPRNHEKKNASAAR